MKRDFKLVQMILERLEQKSDVYSRTDMKFDGYTDQQVAYNALLLHEAGLVDGNVSATLSTKVPAVLVYRMTSNGHDLLDTLRNDTVMQRIKEKTKQSAIDLPFDVLLAAGKAAVVALVS